MTQSNTAELIDESEISMHSEGEIDLYELPFNEKVRTFIRLESLFNEISVKIQATSELDTRSTINSFIALMNVFGRPEIKTDLIKELARISHVLSKYSSIEGVNVGRLQDVQDQLGQTVKKLKLIEGQIGQTLKSNELVMSIRQRNTLPGGALGIDVPNYAHWLAQDIELRNGDIRNWLKEFDLVKEAVMLVLQLIRESSVKKDVVATKGFYQHTLDVGSVTHIIRVLLPKKSPYYPEMSGGRQRFTIRFLKPMGANRPIQYEHDVPFQIICCAI